MPVVIASTLYYPPSSFPIQQPNWYYGSMPWSFLLLNLYTANWTPPIFLKDSMSLGVKADAEDIICHMTCFLFLKTLITFWWKYSYEINVFYYDNSIKLRTSFILFPTAPLIPKQCLEWIQHSIPGYSINEDSFCIQILTTYFYTGSYYVALANLKFTMWTRLPLTEGATHLSLWRAGFKVMSQYTQHLAN